MLNLIEMLFYLALDIAGKPCSIY